MGAHNYFRETVEAGCEASDDSKGTEVTEKVHTFSPDFSTVDYGGRTYQQTDLHRYESVNHSDRPLVLIYSDIGYDLEVYNPGEDTKTTPACPDGIESTQPGEKSPGCRLRRKKVYQ